MTLGGEVINCWAKKRTVKLGKRAVRSHHVGHEIFGDPQRVDGSWVQLQCHCRDRQSERH